MRYLTVEKYNGDVAVLTEADPFVEELNAGDTACWVWQFAETPEQAKAQHMEKMDAFEANPGKDTY